MGTSNSVKYKAMATKAPPFKPFWINLRYSQFVVLHDYCEFSCIFSIVSSLVWCFNSKFCHKHFMLKHNKLKHLFYTNICGVLKLFFVLLSNKFFCFFWTERKLRDLLKNWNQSQNYAINLHWLLNHRIKLILLHSLHMCIHSRYISWCYLYINIWAYSVLIKVM